MLNYFNKLLFISCIFSLMCFSQGSHAMQRDGDIKDQYGNYPAGCSRYVSEWDLDALPEGPRKDIIKIHSKNSHNPWVIGRDTNMTHLKDMNTALGWCYSKFVAKKGDVEVVSAGFSTTIVGEKDIQ